MDRACWNRFGFTLSLGLALAVTPTTRHLQANETDTMPPCGPRCVLVEVTLAKAQPYAPKVLLTGSIEPKFSSNIAFRINGKIEQRLVEIGDHIAADQVLARLDPQVQRANLDAAKAGLVSAQALLTQASVTFDRQSELLKSGPHDKPMTRPSNNSEPSRRQLNSARAAAGTAEEQLGYAELKAGVAGIITARSAEAGQVVQAGQTVFTVAQDGPRDAVFDVYEVLLTDPPSRNVRVFSWPIRASPRLEPYGKSRRRSIPHPEP